MSLHDIAATNLLYLVWIRSLREAHFTAGVEIFHNSHALSPRAISAWMGACDTELTDGHGAVRRGCLFPALTGAPCRQCVGEISTPFTITTHAASHLLRTVILNPDLYCQPGGDSGAFGQIIKCVIWIRMCKQKLCYIVSRNNLNVISVLARPCLWWTVMV